MDMIILTPTLFYISIAVLWYLHFWLYKDYAVDRFRQDIFELRDDLFDQARSGLIDFNHPAYCVLRRTMNGSIRYAHDISLIDLAINLFFTRKNPLVRDYKNSFPEQFEASLDGLDNETRMQLREYRKRLNKLMMKQIVMESPFFLFVTFLFLLALIIPIALLMAAYRNSIQKMRDILSAEINGLESTALSLGKL